MLKFYPNQLENWCYKKNSFETSLSSQFKFSNSGNFVGWGSVPQSLCQVSLFHVTEKLQPAVGRICLLNTKYSN